MVSNLLDASSISIWRYAWRRSSLLNFCPPPREAKISSILGRGYCWTCRTGLMVVLKSPQSRTLPFFFITGTTDDAHSLHSTFVKCWHFAILLIQLPPWVEEHRALVLLYKTWAGCFLSMWAWPLYFLRYQSHLWKPQHTYLRSVLNSRQWIFGTWGASWQGFNSVPVESDAL